MKLINSSNSDKRDELKKLEPLAREATKLLEKQQELIKEAMKLMANSGRPEEDMGGNPFNFAVDLITAYGKLSLELKE